MNTESTKFRNGKPERELLHPIVADWLIANGFEWWYEPIVSETRSRVDFIGKRDGETWLLECKITPAPSQVIWQLNSYHKYYGDPDAKKVLCLPSSYIISDLFQRQCERENIHFLTFDGDFSSTTTLPRRRIADEHPERCTGKIALHGELNRLRAMEKRLLNEVKDLYPFYEMARENNETERAVALGVAIDTLVNVIGFDPLGGGI